MFSGWLNAVVLCRSTRAIQSGCVRCGLRRRAHSMRGLRESGHEITRAQDGGGRAHLKHISHGFDVRSVNVERLVEIYCALCVSSRTMEQEGVNGSLHGMANNIGLKSARARGTRT